MKNKTSQYKFRVKCDQFGSIVPEDFYDKDETLLIDLFEKHALELKSKNQPTYTMVELGSNQAYYSLLFKSILRGKVVRNFMVEPYDLYMDRGKEHFKLNGYQGIFIPKSIGNIWVAHNMEFGCDTITIDGMFKEYNIQHIDVLHSDIDGAEITMLQGAHESLKSKKIGVAFILTHGMDAHLQCIDIISQYDYKVTTDHREDNIGADRLIVIERK